ncbi:GIY-YIG nuclease family protein [Candidatus Parcubacteria bacterium]|jgi:putative endonuclease|nr:MAG: GIY-YIG nuclease family protein [Candidatus Parcubacteria bacterium]
MTNKSDSVLYIGTTRNLEHRVWEHKHKKIPGFTSRYNVIKLVYYEEFSLAMEAVAREKQLKNWHREWKMNLIKSLNPSFTDLADGWDA